MMMAATVVSAAAMLGLLLGAHVPAEASFTCNIPEGIPPAPVLDVTKVHPGHVGVVMSFGDSITAAFAARPTVLEARDISWAIGKGESNQLTVPYMLNQYTNKSDPLTGYSLEPVIPKDIAHLPHNDYHPKTDRLNFAESEGAVHRGSLAEQWQFALEQTPQVAGFKEKWKVVTLWMTANDVCGECKGSSADNGALESWTAGVDQFMSNVTQTMKKAYVNLIGTFPLSNVARVQRANVECAILHKIIDECGCVDRGNETELAQMDSNILLFNAALKKLGAKWNAKLKDLGRTDIAFVYHDYMTHGIGEQLSRPYLSGLDCFHPSAKAHEALAIGLWDSMVCTAERTNTTLCGVKPSIIDPVILCPHANSTLYVPK